MTRIALAVSWEYGRRVGFPMVASILAITVLPYLAMVSALGLPTSAFESFRFHLPYLGIMLVVSGAHFLAVHSEMRDRLFAKPLGNLQVFLCVLVLPLLMMSLGHIFATWLIRSIYATPWPYFRPVFYFVATLGVVLLGYWNVLLGQISRTIIITVTCLPLLLFAGYGAYFPAGTSHPLILDQPFSLSELALLLACIVLVSLHGYQCLCALRSGQDSEWSIPSSLCDNGMDLFDEDFSSAQKALRQLHWRTVLQVVMGVRILTLLATGMVGLAIYHGESAIDALFGLTPILSASVGVALGLVCGGSARLPGPPSSQSLSTFLVTRPVDDRMLGQSFLTTLLWGALYCVQTLAFFVLAAFLMQGLVHGTLIPTIETTPSSQTWLDAHGGTLFGLLFWLACNALCLFCVAALTAALALACRDRWIQYGIIAGSFLVILSLIIISRLRLTHEGELVLLAVAWTTVASLTLVVGGKLLTAVYRQNLLARHFRIFAILIGCVVAWEILPSGWPEQTYLYGFYITFIALPMMAISGVPVAISSARHR